MTSSSESTPKGLNKLATDRLHKELKVWETDPPEGFKLIFCHNLKRWYIKVNGAPETLYANETHQLNVEFPEDYPMRPPRVIFQYQAPIHPKIYSNGHIRLDVLYGMWTPAESIKSICISIAAMLSSTSVKERPKDNKQYLEQISQRKLGR